MALNDRTAKNAAPKEKRYELKDEGGLVLDVTPSGVKTWRFRYYYRGKNYKLTLGPYPLISLKEAREMRDEARRRKALGKNPQYSYKTEMNFAELFAEYKKIKLAKVSERYATLFEQRVNKHILPTHGLTPVKEITPSEILQVVRGIETKKTYDIAHTIRQIYGQILRFGIAIGVCETDPTYALRGALVAKETKHYATITDPAAIGLLLRMIDAYPQKIVQSALRLHAYTFVRPGELRHAEWTEIDLEGALWTIPAEKMKMKRIHLVPLSRQSLEILGNVKKLTGGERYVFPSPRAKAVPMSEAAELAAIRAMGYTKEQFVPHGFRGMASTLLHENGWPSDYIEKQLAHEVGSNVAKAYNHAQYMDKRVEMMQWWADYLDGLRAEK